MKVILSCICILALILSVISFSSSNQEEIDALKKKIEELIKIVGEQNAEIIRLKRELEELKKRSKLGTFLSSIPVVGDVINYFAEKVPSPSEECSASNCYVLLWSSSDHKETCYNAGHSNGYYTFYSCEYFGRCTNESEHRSSSLSGYYDQKSVCSYCGVGYYGSHSCR